MGSLLRSGQHPAACYEAATAREGHPQVHLPDRSLLVYSQCKTMAQVRCVEEPVG